MIETIQSALEQNDETLLLSLISQRAQTIQSALAAHDLKALEQMIVKARGEIIALHELQQKLASAIDGVLEEA